MVTRRLTLLGMAGLAGLPVSSAASLLDAAQAGAQEDGGSASAARAGYAPVNGLEMYFEVHGSGEPLVMLHGAFGSIAAWGAIPEILAAGRQVIAVDFQAHGRTADIDRPLRFEQLADDVATLLDYLEIERADLLGYSMGGNTALQVAIRHPGRVQKLIGISPNYRADGEYAEVLAGIAALTPELLTGTPIEDAYRSIAPDPDGFPALVAKVKALLTSGFAFPEEDLRAIAAPALLVFGDSDTVRPEHAVDLFRLLGGGVPGDFAGLPASRLAILPAVTHESVIAERTDLLLAMIESFLAAPMPEVARIRKAA